MSSDPLDKHKSIDLCDFEMLIRRFSLLCVVLLALGRRSATLW
jgi:hypothetical protein